MFVVKTVYVLYCTYCFHRVVRRGTVQVAHCLSFVRVRCLRSLRFRRGHRSAVVQLLQRLEYLFAFCCHWLDNLLSFGPHYRFGFVFHCATFWRKLSCLQRLLNFEVSQTLRHRECLELGPRVEWLSVDACIWRTRVWSLLFRLIDIDQVKRILIVHFCQCFLVVCI